MADAGQDTLKQFRQEAVKQAGGDERLTQSKIVADKLKVTAKENVKKAMEVAKVSGVSSVPDKLIQQGRDNNVPLLENKFPTAVGGPARELERSSALDTANNRITEANGYVANGFDRMNSVQQDSLRAQVGSQIESSTFSGLITGKTNAEREASRKKLSEGLLRDPNLQHIVNLRLHGLMQEDSSANLANRAIAEARKEGQDYSKLSVEDQEAFRNRAKVSMAKEWADKVDSVVKDATGEYFQRMVDSADDAISSSGVELDEESGIKLAGGLREKRWKHKKGRHGGDMIKEDWQSFSENGIGSFLNGLSDEELTEMGVSSADRNAILTNPAMREKYESQIALNLLSARMKHGGLDQSDVYNLMEAPWCGQEKLIEMFKLNSEAKKFVEKGKKSGEINRSFWEKLRNVPKKDLASILLLILLGAGGFAITGGASVAIAGAIGGGMAAERNLSA